MSAMTGYEIDIRLEDERWTALDGLPELAEKAIEAAMLQIDAHPFSELSIALLGDDAVQHLNKTYRGKDKPTNVLSFPTENSPLLGDIVLAFETVNREAGEKNISLSAHVQHLLIHGFYHLQGYDHETDSDADIMETLEAQALKSLGLHNPYAIETVL